MINLLINQNNNFNMDQIKKVPKILSSVKDIQQSSYHQPSNSQIQKLKQQVSTFIHDIKNEFSQIVGNYQKQLSSIKMESQILKKSRNTMSNRQYQSQSISKRPKSNIEPKKHYNNFQDVNFFQTDDSPILPLNTNRKSKFYQTCGTQLYSGIKKPFHQIQSKQLFPSWGSAFQIHNISPNRQKKHAQNNYTNRKSRMNINNYDDNHFPQQLINPEFQHQRTFQRSRYQRQSQRKRQKQEQIVHFLQSHAKNLNETTLKMMSLIGKQVKQNHGSDQQGNQDNNTSFNPHKSDEQDQHNRSLSQICDSLDKSFVSQKARKSKQKKKQAEKLEQKKRIQQQQQNQKIRKERALKNLLQRLRDNATSVNPPEIVKASKLIPTGGKSSIVFTNNISSIHKNVQQNVSKNNSTKMKDSMVYRKNSKVMINPVPLHNSAKQRDRSPKFKSQKRPTSILKQSSNILTRSISGISAISFQE